MCRPERDRRRTSNVREGFEDRGVETVGVRRFVELSGKRGEDGQEFRGRTENWRVQVAVVSHYAGALVGAAQ
jgi:hypothetical protein